MSSSTPLRRSPEECQAWMQRVHEVHFSRMSPEQREAVRVRADQARERERQAKQCKALTLGASRSYALAKEGLRQMASASMVSPAAALQAQERYRSATALSEARQERVMTKYSPAPTGAALVERAVAEEEEDEEEAQAMMQVADAMGTENVGQLLADVAVASAMPAHFHREPAAEADQSDSDEMETDAPAAPAGARAAVAAADVEVEALLAQLRTEPTEADEVEAKFKLYEAYGEQVEKIRKVLFGFYEQSRSTVPENIGADMQRQIKKVDSHEAMGVPDDDGRVWFVFHMMRQAERNNRSMAAVLEGFERKLDLLAKNDQTECPVCLEAFTEGGVETLSCCHKLCKDCWGTWTEVTHNRPFCPLCKHEEFIGFVARGATPHL